MEVIFIKNKIQNDSTINPELINGVLYHWEVKSTKLLGTLAKEIERLESLNIKYLLIYDVRPVSRFFSDQFNNSSGHAITLESFRIK